VNYVPAMVSKLDESVGRIVQALQKRHMLENSIIVFLSDNGAPTKGRQPNWGSNWPFKGVSRRRYITSRTRNAYPTSVPNLSLDLLLTNETLVA
jgi:arylsulfatase A-like enzyme